MTTKLTDVIIPEVFNQYVINKTMELSELVQSGIIENNSEFDKLASQAATSIQMPFWNDLTGDSEAILEDADLIANKITSGKDVATILRRAKMWAATDLSAALAGSDPMAAIGNLVSGFWKRDMQKELLALLNGVFASPTLADNILDISTKTGAAAKWSANAFIDATQMLGDAKGALSGIMMHSATESELKKQNLIQTVQPSSDVSFGVYQGKRVIVDDNCPVDNGVFTTYIFGQGAIALGNGNPLGFVPTETDRDKKKGSGVDYLINRKTFILHPRGIKFTGANVENIETATRAELQDATNWSRVYDPKKIRIVAFKHKLV